MSGEKCKYVSIQQSELRRLRKQESRLRSIQRDLPERLNAARQQAQRELQQRLTPLEKRARRQEQEAQRLRSNFKNLEQETNKRLQNQRREFQATLKDAEVRQQQALKRESSRLEAAMQEGFERQRAEYLKITRQQRQEYTQLIADQDRKFTVLVEEEKQERQRGQQILQEQIDVMQQREDQRTQLAQNLLADLEVVWKSIDENYQHQRFAPGRLEELHRGLQMAHDNIQSGVSQAAIATTQQTYLALVDLRIELEQKEQEWLLLYNAALEDLRNLITEVQANRNCEVEVGQGNEAEKFALEVNYWTNGSLSQYEQELSQLETQLKEEESTLTTEQLKELGERIISLEPRLGEIVEQAKLAILSSQLRVEIADRVVEVMSEIGYSLEDSVYEGEDQRAAYVVKVKNIAGDEVVTIVSPEKEFGTNSISINTFSEQLIDEAATQQNAGAIFSALEQEGIHGNGELQCREEAQQSYRDLKAVKQRRPAQIQVQSSSSS